MIPRLLWLSRVSLLVFDPSLPVYISIFNEASLNMQRFHQRAQTHSVNRLSCGNMSELSMSARGERS